MENKIKVHKKQLMRFELKAATTTTKNTNIHMVFTNGNYLKIGQNKIGDRKNGFKLTFGQNCLQTINLVLMYLHIEEKKRKNQQIVQEK